MENPKEPDGHGIQRKGGCERQGEIYGNDCQLVVSYCSLLFPPFSQAWVCFREKLRHCASPETETMSIIVEMKRNPGTKCTSLYFSLTVSPTLLILSPDVPRVNTELENRCFQRSPDTNFSNKSVVTVRL